MSDGPDRRRFVKPQIVTISEAPQFNPSGKRLDIIDVGHRAPIRD